MRETVETVGWTIVWITGFLFIGVAYWFAFAVSPWLVSALIASALLGVAYVGLGGRALFPRRERPDRIVGAHVRLAEIDGRPWTAKMPRLDAADTGYPACLAETVA